jgi:ubiquitin C-terminal hydrolase
MDTKRTGKRKQTESRTVKGVKMTMDCESCKGKMGQPEKHFCRCKSGIVNLGNSCYMSAIFQMVAELRLFSVVSEDSQLYTVLSQLGEFSETSLTLELALNEIGNLWTHEGLQEDAFEFFMTILPVLDSFKFHYEYLSQRYCEICHFSYEGAIMEDYSFNMSVDKTLEEQLNETVDVIDEVCGNCGKGYLNKLKTISKVPEVVMVRIMRFQINQKTGRPSKIWNKVKLPEEITLTDRKYRLSVVILHKSKALNHGHYMVYLHQKKIVIDDEKVVYNKPLKLDCSYFYIAFYV